MNTFGFGAMWNINPALRLMAFYEMTTNENSTSIAGYDTDIKDDLFTLRLQYKF
jgi:phosphate-selective porin